MGIVIFMETRLFVASDIHGSAYWCRRMTEAFAASGADRLVLLGDLLYHGPRNALPRDYDPPAVAALLSPLAPRILAVRGNCEAEVDQMVLPFPVMAEYAVLLFGGRAVYLTHGHHASLDSLPPLADGDWFLSGHTHVPMDEQRTTCGGARVRCLNPGSVSIPKGGSAHSYLLLTAADAALCTLDE